MQVKGKCEGVIGGYNDNCNPILLRPLKREADKIQPNKKKKIEQKYNEIMLPDREWLQDNEINKAPDVTHKSCKKDSLLQCS